MDPILAVAGAGSTLVALIGLAIWVVKLVGAPVKDAGERIKAANGRADAAEARIAEAWRMAARMQKEQLDALADAAAAHRRAVAAEERAAALVAENERLRSMPGGPL